MAITIVGSVAFDTLYTNEGTREKILGGSATYASIAASKFSTPSIVGVVGGDFGQKRIDILQKFGIDTTDIEITDGSTFHWTGSYIDNINVAKTIQT